MFRVQLAYIVFRVGIRLKETQYDKFHYCLLHEIDEERLISN